MVVWHRLVGAYDNSLENHSRLESFRKLAGYSQRFCQCQNAVLEACVTFSCGTELELQVFCNSHCASFRGTAGGGGAEPAVVCRQREQVLRSEFHIWFWFSALFCAVLPVIAYLLLTSVPSLASVNTFWVSLVILMLPLAVGFEAGYFWSGRHWRDYLIAGALVGSFSAFELWVVFNTEADDSQGWTKLDWAAGASGIAVGALFVSGVLFGDIYEARTSTTRTRSSAAAFAAATAFSPGAKEPSVRKAERK